MPDAVIDTPTFMQDLECQEKNQRKLDIASGLLLTNTEITAKLGITRSALSLACKANRIFSLVGPDGKSLYPAFFAHRRYDRPTLEAVSKALGDLPGGSKWEFFTVPRLSLDSKTPLDALAGGKTEAVMAAAAAFRDA